MSTVLSAAHPATPVEHTQRAPRKARRVSAVLQPAPAAPGSPVPGSRRRWATATLVAAGAALVLAGCSDDGDATEGSADGTGDEAGAEAGDEAGDDEAPTEASEDAEPSADADLASPAPDLAGPATSTEGVNPPETGVTVTGSGVVGGEPDVVRLTAGVEVERDQVQDAIDDASAATQEVLDALDDRGIADEDVQTRDLAIQPAHGPDGTTDGYLVRNLVEVTVRDVDVVGVVVQDVSDAGGDDTRLHGVGFDLEEDRDLLDAAREAAIDDATEQAQRYAELAGRELGDLVAIQDRTMAQPLEGTVAPDAEVMDDAAAAEAGAPPVEAGEQDVTVRVVTRWTLE